MDVLVAPAKPCRIVDLVLEEDARNMILDEVWRVVNVVCLHKKELLHSQGTQGKHGRPKVSKGRLLHDGAPELDSVQQVKLFGSGLLIFTVRARDDAAAPRVKVKPIEGSESRKVCVISARVRSVPDQRLNVRHEGLVGRELRLELYEDGGRDNVIGEMVMVVIVACIPEVGVAATKLSVALPAGDSSPGIVVVGTDRSAIASQQTSVVEALESLSPRSPHRPESPRGWLHGTSPAAGKHRRPSGILSH